MDALPITALLSTTYFGPIQWYQKLYRYDSVVIEQYESFQKQTYRNRCIIATTQGPLSLTVPVERWKVEGGGWKENSSAAGSILPPPSTLHPPLIKSLRISNHGNWRRNHWNALVSAYGDSPFFDYYQDYLRPFFEEPSGEPPYLIDFNQSILQCVCSLLDIQPNVSLSTQFTPTQLSGECRVESVEFATALESSAAGSPVGNSKLYTLNSKLIRDFREAIRPKHPAPDPDFQPRPYYQVFQQKHGFLPNLSILDLLFNMGPEAIFYL